MREIIRSKEDTVESYVHCWGKEPPDFCYPPRSAGELLRKIYPTYSPQQSMASIIRAGSNFMLDYFKDQHYDEVDAPMVIDRQIAGVFSHSRSGESGILQLDDNYVLTSSASASLIQPFQDVTLDRRQLPVRRCAGASILQFDKEPKQTEQIGLLAICDNSTFCRYFDYMKQDISTALRRLGLPHQIVVLPAGKLDLFSTKTVSVRAWMPSRETYVEVASVSASEDMISRRISLDFHGENGSKRPAHIVSGHLCLQPLLEVVIENNQRKNASIVIPYLLRRYLEDVEVLKPEEALHR